MARASNAVRRSDWSGTKQAKTLAHFEARIAAREAADPLHVFKVLHRLADPSSVREAVQSRIVGGRIVGLADHHEYLRRVFVLRAWCCQKLGWRVELRRCLMVARTHASHARAFRSQGR